MEEGKRKGREGKRGGRDRGGGTEGGVCVIGVGGDRRPCSRYRNVTDGRTDGQTDNARTTYDCNTALALCASRGKKHAQTTNDALSVVDSFSSNWEFQY